MNSNVTLSDNFGFLKAELAELEKKTEAVRQQLIALGAGAYEGDVFRTTVSIAPRATISWKAVAETLRPSFRLPEDKWSDAMREMVAAATTTKDIATVRAVAKIGKAA